MVQFYFLIFGTFVRCSLSTSMCAVGFKIQVGNKSFVGAHGRAIEEDVSRKVDGYVKLLQHCAVECEEKGVIYISFSSTSNICSVIDEK